MALPIPKKELAVMAMVAALTAAIFIYFFSPAEQSQLKTSQILPVQSVQANDNALDHSAHQLNTVGTRVTLGYESALGDLPGALVDTRLRMKLATDEAGNLRVSSDLKEVFDYFLSNIEAEDLDVIVSRINEYLRYHLDEPALSQAQNIFAQYIDYKESLLSLEEQLAATFQDTEFDKNMVLSQLEQQINQRNRLRREHMNPEVHEAFFSEQEVYDEYTLSKIKVKANSQLSSDDKRREIDLLESMLPEHVRAQRNENLKLHKLRSEIKTVKEQGGNQIQIDKIRQDYYGEEAAQRFAELDKEREEWQRRLDVYIVQRTGILSSQGLAQDEKTAQIDALRAQHFDSRERLRVGYLESKI